MKAKPTVNLCPDNAQGPAGVDHVGLGSDFDGVGNALPEGLTGVDTYPALLAELMRRGWSNVNCAKLAGENILCVMAAAERVAASMKNELPNTTPIIVAGAPGRPS